MYPPKLIELILTKRYFTLYGCWLYTGHINKDGYGEISFDGVKYRVHRAIINAQQDEQVNHKRECKSKRCFNPDHLYIGNKSENSDDYYATGGKHRSFGKNECKNGHPYDRTNVRGNRICSICSKLNSRNYAERKRNKKSLGTKNS